MADSPFSSGVLVPKPFAYGDLAGSVAILYTAPATKTGCFAILKSIWLANHDTVDHTVRLYIVEAGGSVADSRLIFPDVTIDAKRMYRIPCGEPLASALIASVLTGDTIRGYADVANKVSYRLSGVEST